MHLTTIPGRWLARAAGLISAGAAIYVLTQDAIRSGHWTTDDLLMPVLVVLTVLASHLVGSAIRARAWLSGAGFAALAVLGTGLIVYTSVGRQAHLADSEDARTAAVMQQIAALEAEIGRIAPLRAAAEAMLADARRAIAVECASGKGGRCQGRQATADVYAAAVKGHDADVTRLRSEIARIGPAPVSGSRAERMASAIAIFFSDEATIRDRLKRAFRLFEPFVYSLFWELGALVALGYGFRHVPTKTVPVPANSNAPVPPLDDKGSDRAQVIDWVREFRLRYGRNPQIPEVQRRFRSVPKTSAWRYIKAA